MKIKYQGPCVECGGVVHNFKRKLCKECYQKEYRRLRESGELDPLQKCFIGLDEPPIIHHQSEREFVANFFTHNNWVYQPGHFRISNHVKYAPDFYDGERNMFIEVSSEIGAYKNNRAKYELMRQRFPKINFEIRNVDGSLFDESSARRKNASKHRE